MLRAHRDRPEAGDRDLSRKRPFHRTDRLNSQIREVLATTIMREARDDVLRQVVITDVEVTSDISLARVYWHPLPGLVQADPEVAQAAFDRAAGFFRKKVGEIIRARQTPELRFIYDTALDRGRRIDDILIKIAREQPPRDVEADAAEASDDPVASDDDGEGDEGEGDEDDEDDEGDAPGDEQRP